MKEFDIFAPLSIKVPGAFNLKDDAAMVSCPVGKKLLITNDTCVEGIHFFKNEPAELIAQKALRSALSNIAAKGGKPFGYILTLILPPYINQQWLENFASGLAQDQAQFGLSLLGGDTSRANTELSVTVTVLGTIAEEGFIARSGALPGDRIYVTGTIGDAYYGLQLQKGQVFDLNRDEQDYLINRYQVPQPRLALGQDLGQFVHAAIDVSDGLIADMNHICKASHQCALLSRDAIPISAAVKNIVKSRPDAYENILNAGNDYELLFTIGPGDSEHVEFLANRHNLAISHIGHIAPATDGQLLANDLVKIIG